MCVPAQEIGLLSAAYDGDVESLICFLETEVPVDSVSPVRNVVSRARPSKIERGSGQLA